MQRLQQDIQQLLINKKFSQALKILKTNLAKYPHNPELIRLKGIVDLHQGKLSSAEKYFIKAIKVDKNYAPAITNLAYVKQNKGDLNQAKILLEKSIKLNPNSVETLHQLAIIHNLLDDFETAEHYFEQVLTMNPHHNESRLNLAVIYKNKGEIKSAIDYLHQSLDFNPMQPQVYWVLANLKSYQFNQSEKEIVSHLLTKELPNKDQVALLFTQAKIREDDQKYAESFNILKQANTLKYRSLNQKPTNWSGLLKEIQNVFTPDYVSDNQNKQAAEITPILIAGMPRSGSTLIEQILASHSKITGASELNYLSELSNAQGKKYPASLKNYQQHDYTQLGQEYLKLTERWSKNATYFTDKMPHNINYAGVLLMANRNARLIHTRRHPMDVCLSVYKQNFESGQHYSYDLLELVQYYKFQELIAEHWKSLFPDRVISIDYEQVIAQTEEQTRKMLDFIGLEFEAACLEFYRTKRNIGTASAGQVTQKIYQSGSHYYKNYGDALDELSMLLDKPFGSGKNE